MDHILANSWRPASLSDVVGQETTVGALKNALGQNILHHCYIFTGIRGVGKTSLARLFAQGLNCEKGLTSTPCGKCPSCLGIKAGNDLDCYEIDAASRTKVEETLKILELANYPPTRSRYKIFLIDEVHMLSNHSFNALLKTLEQPPEYVKFLLATTDVFRIPDTVRSRCIEFQLSPISKPSLIDHLSLICDKEKYTYETSALDLIAMQASGSLRDAITHLQSIMTSTTNGSITVDLVESSLGILPESFFGTLFESLSHNDSKAIEALLDKVGTQSINHLSVIDQFINYLGQNLKASSADTQSHNWIQIALLTKRDFNFYPNAKIAFEIMVMRMLVFKPNFSSQSNQSSSKELNENQIEVKKKIPNTQLVDQKILIENQEDWLNFSNKLSLEGFAKQIIEHSVFKTQREKVIHVTIDVKHKPIVLKRHIEKINESIKTFGFTAIEIVCSENIQADHIKDLKEKKEEEITIKENKEVRKHQLFKKISEHLDVELV
ncbi:MAG: DNA polymerase III, subunit gamma and tau [Legionellales bacterium]|nr:DNA polymerase III, subunit gamma and tau [Legionellales bacterium]OUX65845.1 MAG: DNA polymerase III, subunit gamma and tau [Gammaproteobacteria bacterium TMED281]